MINSIEIKNIATFDSVHGIITDLKKVNFFYGANGSGKTTISRVLANPSSYHESKISWENDEEGDIIVYNHDFVNRNFNSSSEIPGIYTLGEGSIEIEKKIQAPRPAHCGAVRRFVLHLAGWRGRLHNGRYGCENIAFTAVRPERLAADRR